MRRSGESGWGEAAKRWNKLTFFMRCAVTLFVLGSIASTIWFFPHGSEQSPSSPRPAAANAPVVTEASPDEDLLAQSYLSADRVARAFLSEPDPEKRLQWVREPEKVKKRMAAYSDEARSEVGSIQDMLEHSGEGVGALTSFLVSFSAERTRMLEVVGTAKGAKVDWDAYARYGTASWDKLLSGAVKRAVVRVFCEPAVLPVKPFGKEEEWTCFRISSPDLPDWVLGYVRVDNLREAKMREAIQAAPNSSQRFTLEVVRHEVEKEPVFEISKCLAVGWVVKGDLETEWGAADGL